MLKMPFLTDDDLLVVEFSNLFVLTESIEIVTFHSIKRNRDINSYLPLIKKIEKQIDRMPLL